MDLCGTDNLLELKQGVAGPTGSTGTGEVTEILSIRGALSIPHKPGTFSPLSNGNASHTFDEIIRTKTVADPNGVFKAITNTDFVLGGSTPGEPSGQANITLTGFLNTSAKKFSAHVSLNALVRPSTGTISQGTALPAITDSRVGLLNGFSKNITLDIVDIDEDKIVIGVYSMFKGTPHSWKDLIFLVGQGFYYTLTIFAVKD